jgi:flagellar hook-associated protein 2
LAITRSTNTITDAVSDITFTLKQTGSSTITVANDSAALKTKIAAFVDSFNAAQEFINTQLKNNGDGKPIGILARDSTLREVQRGLREFINSTAAGNGGAFTALSDIGITRDETGKLKIDQDIINDKLKTSTADVRSLFAGKTVNETGLAATLVAASDNLGSSVQAAVTGYDATIKRIDKNIASQQARLDILRETLTRQFAAADAAIGQLNGQGTALTSVLKSLEPRDDR